MKTTHEDIAPITPQISMPENAGNPPVEASPSAGISLSPPPENPQPARRIGRPRKAAVPPAPGFNQPGAANYDHHHIDVRWWSWQEALEDCWRLGMRISKSRLMHLGRKKKAFRCGKAAGAKSHIYLVDRWSFQRWLWGKTEAPNGADTCEKVTARRNPGDVS